ncbi:hypothetical protein [Pararhizobium haloflavum]|uniref:hypothetical protein n=1 Tax=Pararhizobium haloflavum TaxID=2037914 RepID=UPI000C178229|nr:hypothetical protein [Pararhizobium haloflavum]
MLFKKGDVVAVEATVKFDQRPEDDIVFLEYSPGSPTPDRLKMVRPNLKPGDKVRLIEKSRFGWDGVFVAQNDGVAWISFPGIDPGYDNFGRPLPGDASALCDIKLIERAPSAAPTAADEAERADPPPPDVRSLEAEADKKEDEIARLRGED